MTYLRTMDIYKIMKNRRSTRSFSATAISDKILQRVLSAGTYAPSGANQKPYAYVMVKDPVLKEQIRTQCERVDQAHYQKSPEWFKDWMDSKHISLTKSFLTDAPCLVVIIGESNKPYWLESTWLSIAYILLAAEQESLVTLTYTPAEIDFLYDILSIPAVFKPVVILPIGYPKKP